MAAAPPRGAPDDPHGRGNSDRRLPRNPLTFPPTEIHAPPFPPRPDLFDEVEWGPFPTKEEVEKAYRVWSEPNSQLAVDPEDLQGLLGDGIPALEPDPKHCLVENVYQKLLERAHLPLNGNKVDHVAQFRYDGATRSAKGWTYEELFGRDPTPEAALPPPTPPPPPTLSPETLKDIHERAKMVNGRDILNQRNWRKAAVDEELNKRGISPGRTVPDNLKLIHQYEMRRLEALERERAPKPEPEPELEPEVQSPKDKGSLLPREDLSEWGIPREKDFMLKIVPERELFPLDMYTWAILLSPYNPAYWTSRAYLHYQIGYFDLAIGDAYRAQLLCEVLVNPLNRNAQPGLYTRIWDAIERHVLQIPPRNGGRMSDEVKLMRQGNGINNFIPSVRKALHHLLALSLLAMQCWKDYKVTEPALRTRLAMPDQDAMAIRSREEGVRAFVDRMLAKKHSNEWEFYFERRYGLAHGRTYPYGPHTNHRTTKEFVDKINRDFISGSLASEGGTQKIEVRVDEARDELGVYATEDIRKGEVVYADEPSLRGHLRLGPFVYEDKHCENCRRYLNPLEFVDDSPNVAPQTAEVCACYKSARQDVYWCPSRGNERPNRKRSREPTNGGTADNDDSDDRGSPSKRQKSDSGSRAGMPSCLEIAQTLYHHRACGKDWTWLEDTMRPKLGHPHPDLQRDFQIEHTNEGHGTVLSLVLREVFDITLKRRETENKPHLLAYEIDELMPLMGAEDLSGNNFPFSFAANIRVPFDILSFLGVNIFRDLTFDTWVIQIVLRKLLLNVIPWQTNPHGARDETESQHSKETKDGVKGSLRHIPLDYSNSVDPTFRNLYIFPGVAMFNHHCPPHHNVNHQWDRTVPNRLILWANQDIKTGEQLFIQYTDIHLDTWRALQILGDRCFCPKCKADKGPLPTDPHDLYGLDSSPSSSDNEEDDPSGSQDTQQHTNSSESGDGESSEQEPDDEGPDEEEPDDEELDEEQPNDGYTGYPPQYPQQLPAGYSPPYPPRYSPYRPPQLPSQYPPEYVPQYAPPVYRGDTTDPSLGSVPATGHGLPSVLPPQPQGWIVPPQLPEEILSAVPPIQYQQGQLASGQATTTYQPHAPQSVETGSEPETVIEIKKEPGTEDEQLLPLPQAPAPAPAPAPIPAAAPPAGGRPRTSLVRYQGRYMDVQEYRAIKAQEKEQEANSDIANGSVSNGQANQSGQGHQSGRE